MFCFTDLTIYVARRMSYKKQEVCCLCFCLYLFSVLYYLQILPVSLDNLFLAAPSGFSNVYLQLETHYY